MSISKSILAFALLLTASSVMVAQPGEPKVTKTKVINASADAVWEKLRVMDDLQKYSSHVAIVKWTGDHGVGGERKCLPPEGLEGYYLERIVNFNDEQRTYSYALVEGVPVKGMVNTFKVVDLGYRKSMIIWTSSFEQFLENPQMTEEQFLGFINQAVGETIDLYASAAEKS